MILLSHLARRFCFIDTILLGMRCNSITFTNENFSVNIPGKIVFKIINSQVLSCSFYRSAEGGC